MADRLYVSSSVKLSVLEFPSYEGLKEPVRESENVAVTDSVALGVTENVEVGLSDHDA